MKISLSVDREICKQCYACIEECPFDLINKDKDAFPLLRKAAVKKCIRCGHCMAVCVSDALDITVSPLETCPPVDTDLMPSPDSVTHFLKSRRSIRSYKKKCVDHGTLEALMDVSRYAPSAHNCQQTHWIMVENPSEVRRLAGLVVAFMKELKLYPGLVRAWDQGVDKVLRGAPHLAIGHVNSSASEHPVEDSVLAASYLDLTAHSYGIGVCWAGFLVQAIHHQYQPLIEALQLPEGHTVHAALMLGYSKFRYRHIPQRDPLKVVWR